MSDKTINLKVPMTVTYTHVPGMGNKPVTEKRAYTRVEWVLA